MKVVLFISLIVSCLTISEQCNAAVSVGGTRLIFDGNEREASISVNNTSNGTPVLIQSWIDGSNGSQVKAPFMITPPLFRLEPRPGQYTAGCPHRRKNTRKTVKPCTG